jgi:hypothetical protein
MMEWFERLGVEMVTSDMSFSASLRLNKVMALSGVAAMVYLVFWCRRVICLSPDSGS